MLFSTITLVIFIPLLVLLLAVPVLICVYVYRDAKRRRMNPVLWTLIALLAPTFLGFIIYLLVRSPSADCTCPNCGADVTESYVVCPRCGAKLHAACGRCGAPVEPDWQVCPRCASPLTQPQADVTPPVRRKDRTLWKILVAIIAIPVVLILVSLLLFASVHSSGSASLQYVTRDELYAQLDGEATDAVRAWVEPLDARDDRAYALCYVTPGEDLSTYCYLVYVPGAADSSHTGFGSASTLLGTTVKLELQRTGNSGGFYCIQTDREKEPRLIVTVDGKKYPCEVTEVEYNPTVYTLEAQSTLPQPSSAD